MTIVLALSLPNEKAKTVVKLLLELGATSAQADFNHYTVFHYIVSQNKLDILDVLLTHDRPAALSVINNIASQAWGNEGDSPLITAIEKKYPDMVAKLLSLGAKPEIGFDEWIKAYLEKNQWARSNTPERNLEMYRTSVYQPIISAASKEMGKTVEDLVAYGADPKTLEKTTWSVVQDHHNHPYQITETLLDVIQKKIKSFRE
jgi:ankyrin repeat protein